MGFVFAIPRSRQQGTAPLPALLVAAEAPPGTTPQRLSDYAANTNLEQISDWLTKILVGIGLVEFKTLLAAFDALTVRLAPIFGGGETAQAFAGVLMTYFGVWGFFFGYLTTRLWMPKALSRAESEEAARKQQAADQAELNAILRQAYGALYEAPPMGFAKTISTIEGYHEKPGSRRTPWLWTYLAAAYGQKHAYESSAGHGDVAELARTRAVEAVDEALRLGSETRPILEQLYHGRDAGENDLASLRGDSRLDELLPG
ncbi:MAG: hypothetical protein ABL982_02030 [Vicinamibacterales bacterium]